MKYNYLITSSYLCIMNYLELFGTLVGLVYLWLEYRASIYLWLACIIMPAIYLVVYYQPDSMPISESMSIT